MPYRAHAFAPGHIYHLYNRGIDHQPIFAAADNYFYLLRKAKRLLDELPLTLLAYCLMPNHFHLVVRQDGEAPVSTLVQRLFQTYTQAYNKQQGRKGPLLEGRFRHAHVDRDEYAIHLCRYVHLNPVQAGLAARPEDWPYSNYLEWIGARPGSLVDRAFVQQFFPTGKAYAAFVRQQLTTDQARMLHPYMLDEGDLAAHLPESQGSFREGR